MSIAHTILHQIRIFDPMALFAWGAKDFVNRGDGLQFKTSGMTKYKGHVYVKYNAGSDLYEVTFFRIRKMEQVIDKTVTDVYAEDLVGVIDETVG
jgi:hypothetical protein